MKNDTLLLEFLCIIFIVITIIEVSVSLLDNETKKHH